jgi:hypothetical protein
MMTAIGGIIFYDEFSSRRWKYYPITMDAMNEAIELDHQFGTSSWKQKVLGQIGFIEPIQYSIGFCFILLGSIAMILRYDHNHMSNVAEVRIAIDEGKGLLDRDDDPVIDNATATSSLAANSMMDMMLLSSYAGDMITSSDQPSHVNYYERLTAGYGSSRRSSATRQQHDLIEDEEEGSSHAENMSDGLSNSNHGKSSGGASGNYGAIGSNSQKRRELPAMLATTERSSRRSALIDYGKHSVPTTTTTTSTPLRDE